MRKTFLPAILLAAIIASGCSYTFEDLRERAIEQISEGSYIEAEKTCREILDLSEKYTIAYVLLGESMDLQYREENSENPGSELAKHLRETAIKHYLTALKKLEKEESYTREQIKKTGDNQKLRTLVATLEGGIIPMKTKVSLRLGDIFLEEKEYVDAFSMFQKVLLLEPENLMYRYKIALAIEHLKGEEERAIRQWEFFLYDAQKFTSRREKYGIKPKHLKRAMEGIKELEKRQTRKYLEKRKKKNEESD